MTTFTVGELARRTTVTVRTLHHYERIGLLVPSERTASGHRRYGPRDVVRLRHIVTLKRLGVPLREIAALLLAAPADLLGALRARRALLCEQRDDLDAAIRRIDALEHGLLGGDGVPARGDLEALMETIAMENQMAWGRRYLTEVRGMTADQVEAEMRASPPEALEGTRRWAALITDVEAALAAGVEPSSERARELARRWQELLEAFTQGDPAKAAEVRRFYAELPPEFPRPYSEEVARFINAAGGRADCTS
ncbi:MAG TPA: MerR family transcriptional regulator [Candidatus Limnocylindria bacterium]|jgi:DNA-binding transcriptional MerR regulator|nr:MerR family transcriptional regulator [Candidatus Limnocylindria bacterium]